MVSIDREDDGSDSRKARSKVRAETTTQARMAEPTQPSASMYTHTSTVEGMFVVRNLC